MSGLFYPRNVDLRSPMQGASGRVYEVLGENDVPKRAATLPPLETDGEWVLIVSVASPPNYHAVWQPTHHRVEQLHFWDARSLEAETLWMPCLTQAGADALALKVLEHPYRRFILQCEAGVSRSAGLCVAVARHFGDDAVAEECYARFAPNELVVDRMRAALKEGEKR